jgi:hypothetical protein
MGEDINRLLEAKFIIKLKEETWLSPPVMVEKKDMKIYHMCINFTVLNKHFPKDYFSLPRIDSNAGCERPSFLHAYSGYHQIRLKVEDEKNTAFIMPHGVYCYTTMSFGPKNASATYQRCMQVCLKDQINRNIEVYVDKIEVKTNKVDSLLDNLHETLKNLDRYGIKFNPKKCSFRVPTRQLGYLISERGIKGNPKKILAIIEMEQSWML